MDKTGKKTVLKLVFIFILLGQLCYVPAQGQEAIVDTHAHLIAGRAQGLWSSQGNDFRGAIAVARSVMRKFGVGRTLVMPPPFTPGQNNIFTMDDLVRSVGSDSHDFAFLGGGGTLNVMLQESVRRGEVGKELIDEFEKTALALLEKGALGFGELAAEHVSKGARHPYQAAPPDHLLLLKLADIAADHDVVIDLHMEAVPEDISLPSGLASPPNPPILKANIKALERLLAHNPGARIVWAHAGWDNTGYRSAELCRKLLRRHLNLFMSIKINKDSLPENTLLGRDRTIKQEWFALLQEFPDRFLLGTDLKYGLLDKRRLEKNMKKGVQTFLDGLPPDLLHKLVMENPRRIFKF